MTNLLEETITALKEHGKNPSDVLRVGIRRSCDSKYEKSCTWDEFHGMAKDLYYNRDFDESIIKTNLIISGDDWWLSRHPYDGLYDNHDCDYTERWKYNTISTIDSDSSPMRKEDLLQDDKTDDIDYLIQHSKLQLNGPDVITTH